jgi:SNF2 family DNA or RNA helicase
MLGMSDLSAMSAGNWRVKAGALRLLTQMGEEIVPTAAEVFGAEFSRATTVRGVSVPTPSTDLPELKFSRFPAQPAYRVFETSSGLTFQIGVMTGRRCFRTIPAGVDQFIADEWWFPVQPSVLAEARAWATSIGLVEEAPLTLGGLIALRTRGDRPVPLIDEITATSASLGNAAAESAGPIAGLVATLYPYQSVGVAFLGLIAAQGIGCVLADAMGLGKTLQVIGLLMAEQNAGRGPTLVIAPATLLENWRRELKQFVPSLSVSIHAGPSRAGTAARLAGADVTLVSYETAVRDESLLGAVKWNILVLDEAQNIRNPEAQRTQVVKRLDRRVSIAVTGTPLENRLDDLWSVTDFALPGLLGSLSQFRREYHEIAGDAARVGQLVSPIILRRTVEEVAQDLPERIDIPQSLVMSGRLAAEYERLRREILAEYGPAGSLVAIIRLRVCCAHPSLTGAWAADPSQDMPKYARLIEILDEVFSGAEKALVFSTFQDMADLMLRDLSPRFPDAFFRVIDGRVPVEHRQSTIDEFFAHSGHGALILNPKAAGTGLNITAANHVIHYNPEWNPAVTDQATARAYRRRQTRPVTVHYLYFLSCIEEVMMDRAAFKRLLAGEAVQGHHGEVDARDLAHALQLSPVAGTQ